MKKKEQDGQEKGLCFFSFFFQNKTDLYLKKLEERGTMQCGKGKEYTWERKYPVGVIKGENFTLVVRRGLLDCQVSGLEIGLTIWSLVWPLR